LVDENPELQVVFTLDCDVFSVDSRVTGTVNVLLESSLCTNGDASNFHMCLWTLRAGGAVWLDKLEDNDWVVIGDRSYRTMQHISPAQLIFGYPHSFPVGIATTSLVPGTYRMGVSILIWREDSYTNNRYSFFDDILWAEFVITDE